MFKVYFSGVSKPVHTYKTAKGLFNRLQELAKTSALSGCTVVNDKNVAYAITFVRDAKTGQAFWHSRK